MSFISLGNRVINLNLVTDVSFATIEERGIPCDTVVISFSHDNFVELRGDHARVAWEFFSAMAFGLPVLQVAP